MTKYIYINDNLPPQAAEAIATILAASLELFSEIGPMSGLPRQELVDLMASEDTDLFAEDDAGLATTYNECVRYFGKALALAYKLEDILAEDEG